MNRVQYTIHDAMRNVVVLLSFGLLGFGLTSTATAQSYTSVWTGAENDQWFEDGNWTAGVPGVETQAVFTASTAEEFTIRESSANIQFDSLFFSADTPAASVMIEHGGAALAGRNFDLRNSDTVIEVEAGGPAVTVNVGGGRFVLSSTAARIVNNSDNMLTLTGTGGLFNRGSTTSGIRIDGSGDITMNGTSLQRSGGHLRELTLLETFSGTLHLNANYNMTQGGAAPNPLTVDGGTLVMNSTMTHGVLVVNDGGTFSGAGESRRQATFNSGAVVNPGTVGGTGAFTFSGDNTVTFETGSLLRLDLLDKDTHDRLLFDELTEGEGDIPTLSLSTAGDGVILDLNLLPGFAAAINDQFEILSGYQALNGYFKLADGTSLTDGAEFEVDGTLFRINYGSTTLTVIPEPGAGGLLLLGLAGVLCWRRRR